MGTVELADAGACRQEVLGVETAVLARRMDAARGCWTRWSCVAAARRSSCARTSENDPGSPARHLSAGKQRAMGAEHPAGRVRASGEGVSVIIE